MTEDENTMTDNFLGFLFKGMNMGPTGLLGKYWKKHPSSAGCWYIYKGRYLKCASHGVSRKGLNQFDVDGKIGR